MHGHNKYYKIQKNSIATESIITADFSKSASVFTSRCVLPSPSPCCRSNHYGKDSECLFVYGEPRCVVHSHRADAGAQIQPTCHNIEIGAINKEQHESSRNPSIGLLTSSSGLPQCYHQSSRNCIGEILSPKVYKALYETTKLVVKDPEYAPVRDNIASHSAVNAEIGEAIHEPNTYPAKDTKNIATPIIHTETNCIQPRAEEKIMSNVIEALSTMYQKTFNSIDSENELHRSSTRHATMPANISSRLLTTKNNVLNTTNAPPEMQAIEPLTKVQTRNASSSAMSQANNTRSVAVIHVPDSRSATMFHAPDARSAAVLTSSVYNAPTQRLCCYYLFEYPSRRPMEESTQTCSNCCARIADAPHLDDINPIEECVKTHLVASCRYYSNLLTKQLGRVKENLTKRLAPPIEDYMYQVPTLSYVEACTMKPSGRDELGCQTNKHRPTHKTPKQSCVLSPAVSSTEICRYDKEHLNSVYYMLTAIEGRLRRLKSNIED